MRVEYRMILCLLLPLLTLQLQLPLINKPSDPKNYLPVIINSGGHLLQLGFSPESYIFAKLQSSKFSPDFLTKLFSNPSFKQVNDTYLTCASNYCTIDEVKTKDISVDQQPIGAGISAAVDIEIRNLALPKFPMYAVYAKKPQLPGEGRISFFTLMEMLKGKGYIKGENATLVLGGMKSHISFDQDAKLRQLVHVPLSKKQQNSLKIDGLLLGQQVFNITELVLNLDIQGLHLPVHLSLEMLKLLSSEGITCEFLNNQMICQYSTNYPELSLMLSNSTIPVHLDRFLTSCYYSFDHNQLLCGFDITTHQKVFVHAGRLFLEAYPPTFDFKNNLVILNSGKTSSSGSSIIVFFIERVLGLKLIEVVLFLVFVGLLGLIKCYHFIYKCRPVSSYSKYGNLVSTSASSIQSQNSERDPKEIETVKDLQIQEI